MATLVAEVRSILAKREIAFKSVARRFETLYIAQAPGQELAALKAQILEALGPDAKFDQAEAYFDKGMKLNYVWFTNLHLAGVAPTEISKPQAPVPAPASAPKKGKSKKQAPVPAPKNDLRDEMEQDEGLLDDMEMDLPQADLADL